MILISQQHNEDRLAGTLATLVRGPNAPKIKVYSAGPGPERPAAVEDTPVGTLLCTITLDDPPGSVLAGRLTFTLPDDALVMADGTARWARFLDGNGDGAIDCDVSLPVGAGELKLQVVDLQAGGAVRLVSAEFG